MAMPRSAELPQSDSQDRRPTGEQRQDERQHLRLFGGFRLGKLFGVEIGIDYSLIIIFALITFNLGAAVFPRWHPGWGAGLIWGTALGAAVLFFVSVLLHELSHAVVARTQGVPVRRITLFLFGGIAHMEAEPPSPMAEFLIAVVGPITSLAIGILGTLAGHALAGRDLMAAESAEEVLAAFRTVGPVPTLLLWLGPINVLLGLFNIVPGFPLDGGRVLRSILWGATKDLRKATRWASLGGQFVAWALMGIGILQVFQGNLGGLWLLLIGWFLNNAAKMSYQQLVVQQALENVPVAQVMQTRLERVPPDISVDELVKSHLMNTDQRAFPVESQGNLVGLVCFEDLRKIPQQEWPTTIVRQVMTPVERLSTLPPDAGAEQAFKQLTQRDVNQLPVVQGGHLLGIVRRSDLMKWLTLQGIGGRSPSLSS